MLGPVFKSSIMGPKRIKHATVDAPKINIHDGSKYGCPFPLVDNGESTDSNERENPQEGSNVGCNGRKCLVNLIKSNGPSCLVDPNGLIASTQQLGHEDHHTCGQSHKVYHSHNDNVARLREITLADDFVRLREIGLAAAMAQGLSLLQQQGHEDWRFCAHNDNVVRHMAPFAKTLERLRLRQD